MSYVLVILATLLALRIWTKHMRPRWNHLKSALRHPYVPERVTTPSRESPSSTGKNREYGASIKPKKKKARSKSSDPYSHGFSGKSRDKASKPN